MSTTPDDEEYKSEVFEDAEDFLEFCYEKIEDAVYFWTLWAKTFLPEVNEEVVRGLILEFAGSLHEELHPKLTSLMLSDGVENHLFGLIKRVTEARKSEEETNHNS